jgi:1,4-alpha-glucan branching enzyme
MTGFAVTWMVSLTMGPTPEKPLCWTLSILNWSGFQWIDFSDADNSVIAYLRKAKSTQPAIVCLCNFTPMPRHHYRIGVPEPGWYRELVNTDGITYGGSNMGNGGGIHATETPSHGFPYSLTITLPPLSILFLKR